MHDEIKVYVVDRGRSCFYMRYCDPVTGKAVEKSTGQKSRKEAGKVAAKWEADLQEGRYKPPSKVTWAEFRRRYEVEVLPSLKPRTETKACSAFNAVEEHLPEVKDGKLNLLTSERLSRLQSLLREKGLAEDSIKGHLAHLLAALNWAKRIAKILVEVPAVVMPKRAKGSKMMKGRPLALEEFERMLAAVEKVVGRDGERSSSAGSANAARVESLKHLLKGLWTSGLRLGEALDLWWDRDDHLCVVECGHRLMLLIHAHLEKGKEDRLLPIALEFETFLRETPKEDRHGRVFRPLSMDGSDRQMTAHHVGLVVSEIGKKAGVKVLTNPRTGNVKFASSHDLRRTFGTRWARRLMPAELQQLMRHESIQTTLKYYVELDAMGTAEKMWQAVAVGDTFGDTRPVRAPEPKSARQKTRRKSK